MTVRPSGGTPSPPPQRPGLNTEQKAANLRTATESFSTEVREFIKNPHLTDSPPALENFATTVKILHEAARQAIEGRR